MARRSNKETTQMFKSMAVLLRNTTWKCGRLERLVVKNLQSHFVKEGKAWSNIRDMLSQFKLQGKQKNEFFDALRRLEKRRIIKIEFFEMNIL
jgi:hypothetical protein